MNGKSNNDGQHGDYFDQDQYFVGDKSNYSRLPGGYMFLRRALFWKGKIKRIARYKPAGRVLDIGCAYGFLLYFMKDRYDVHGCDISAHAIAKCRRLFKDLPPDRFFVHDINEPLPQGKDYFDVIICQDVIEHLPDIDVPLRNIHDALKPGGIFFFRIPIKTGNRAAEVLRMERDPTHVSVLPQQVLIDRVKRAGFTILEKRYVWMAAIPLPKFFGSGSDINLILRKD